jgi:hypothetical protein
VSRPGLESQRWIDPVEEFVRRHGHNSSRWAIACTYEVDLPLIQRVVLPVLSRRGCAFRTVILSDAARLEAVLTQVSGPFSGAINLHSVWMRRGVFHPKLLLLRAGGEARACFGSANLTSAGLNGNLELWSHSDDPVIVAAIVDFLTRLTASPGIDVDPAGQRSLRAALRGMANRPHPSVWSSLDGSFEARLRRRRNGKASRALVISPMYATPAGLRRARAAIPTRRLELFTDEPVQLSRVVANVLRPAANVDGDDGEPDERQIDGARARAPTILHAKAYVFPRGATSGADAWIGSANFTAQALSKGIGDGGNVELMVEAALPKDELARFTADLEQWFLPVTGPIPQAPAKVETLAEPLATVMSCELIEGRMGPALIVYSIRRDGTIELVFEGRHVTVAIKRGRGSVDGAKLRGFMPLPDLSAATPLVIHQWIGGRLQPVVVNVPHVPPGPQDGGAAFGSVDAMIADMMGRVPVRRPSEDPDARGPSEAEDDGVGELPPDELERRLDEVRHQGGLDKVAVSMAVLLKLIARCPSGERSVRRAEALALMSANCPPHLQQVVRANFATGHAS